MPDIKVKGWSGADFAHKDVPLIWLADPSQEIGELEEGETPALIPFTYGQAVSKTVEPDFSGGDMEVPISDGELVTGLTITKPETLSPENVRFGTDIAGVTGEFLGDTEETIVELSMAEGDQVVEPSAEGKVLSKVTITKPETLIPENVRLGITVGGVIGEYQGDILENTEEVEVELDMADGDQIILPSEDAKAISKAKVKKPATLIPENIAEGVDIAGIVGTLSASGSSIKTANGTVTGNDGAVTVTHGLGVTPDIILAYVITGATGLSSSYYLERVWGLSTALKSLCGFGYHHIGIKTNGSTMSKFSFGSCIDGAATNLSIKNANANTFQLGSASGGTAPTKSGYKYAWLAIGGLT